jgi:hypothetical protein
MLPLRDERPPFLGDPPLLLLEERLRVGAGAGEGELELLPEGRLLLLDEGEQIRLRLGQPGVRRRDALQRAAKKESCAGGQCAGRQPGGGHRERAVVAEGERDPESDGRSRLETDGRREHRAGDALERSAREGQPGEDDAAGEEEIGDRRQRHFLSVESVSPRAGEAARRRSGPSPPQAP